MRGGGEIESDLLGSFEDLWNVGTVVGSDEGLGNIFHSIITMFKKLLSWIAAKIKALFAAKPKQPSKDAEKDEEQPKHVDIYVTEIPPSEDERFIEHLTKYFDAIKALNEALKENTLLDYQSKQLLEAIQDDQSYSNDWKRSVESEVHYTTYDSLNDGYRKIVSRMENLKSAIERPINKFIQSRLGIGSFIETPNHGEYYKPGWAVMKGSHTADIAGKATGTKESIQKYDELCSDLKACCIAVLKKSTWYISKLHDICLMQNREYQNNFA